MISRGLLLAAILLLITPWKAHGEAQSVSFLQPWRLTEDEPKTWAQDEAAVRPDELRGWREYDKTTLPMGFNQTVWLHQTIPAITASGYGLFFANGLEDLAVYLNGVPIYRYGDFSRSWAHGSSQRWHFIPLSPADSGKTLQIRTHSMISYMTRTLYPTIRLEREVFAEQWNKSLVFTMTAGTFGALALIFLTIALQRRKIDVFFHFGVLTLCASSWIMFNQDSLVKQFTGIPTGAWSFMDLAGLYVAVPALFAFFENSLHENSKITRTALRSLWTIAAIAGISPVLGWVHPWYFLPIMHLVALPALVTILPRMVFSSLHRNQEARYLTLGSLFVSVSGMHDAARYTGLFASPLVQMIPLGMAVMVGSMMLVLLQRYRSEQLATIKTIKNLNAELQTHVHKVEALVEEKTREIRSILGSIQQGIFMVEGQDLLLNREYSAHLETLLEDTQMGGRSFRSCFLDRSGLGADQKHAVESVLQLALDEEETAFALNASNLPTEIHTQSLLTRKTLELSWAPILDEAHITRKILVTARDVTGLRELQEVARQSQEEIELVQLILAQKPERFARFLQSSQRLLEHVSIGNLHTLKGNARAFNLDQMANLIHQSEQTCLRADWTALQDDVETLRSLIQRYEQVLHQRVGWNLDTDQVMLNRQQLEKFYLQPDHAGALDGWLLPQVFTSADELFREVFHSLDRVAEDLGKDKPRLDFKGTGLFFPKTIEVVLNHCFGHLLRNALDHGIELPDERRRLGKKASGTVSIHLNRVGPQLKIRLYDDGRGLDWSAIREKALRRGAPFGEAQPTADQIEELIFTNGFSTKTETSLVSGRGVGLDAVRGLLREIHGQIHLSTQPFAFELTLPAGTFLEFSAVPTERARYRL